MQTSLNEIIDLLSSILFNCKPKLLYDANTEWNGIRELAIKHRVDGLVYTAIKNNLINSIDSNIFKEWQKDTFQKSLTMHNLIVIIVQALKVLKDNNIEFIVLKGLAVRNFFSYPDLRTMSDADILVHKDDMVNIDRLLKLQGYQEYGRTEHHITYVSKNRTYIEVHWTLDKHSIKVKKYILPDNIWHDAIDVSVGDEVFKSLCLEDLLTHLCFHMACHMADSGFGVRQLLDLVLVVNKEKNNINWEKFMNNISACGIEKFTFVIFKVCNYLFNMDVPDIVAEGRNITEKEIEIISDEILKYGVYGNKEISNVYSNKLGYSSSDNKKTKAIKNIVRLVFPSKDRLDDKYSYAKKNTILLPVAYTMRAVDILRKVGSDNKIESWKSIINSAKNKSTIYNILEL